MPDSPSRDLNLTPLLRGGVKKTFAPAFQPASTQGETRAPAKAAAAAPEYLRSKPELYLGRDEVPALRESLKKEIAEELEGKLKIFTQEEVKKEVTTAVAALKEELSCAFEKELGAKAMALRAESATKSQNAKMAVERQIAALHKDLEKRMSAIVRGFTDKIEEIKLMQASDRSAFQYELLQQEKKLAFLSSRQQRGEVGDLVGSIAAMVADKTTRNKMLEIGSVIADEGDVARADQSTLEKTVRAVMATKHGFRLGFRTRLALQGVGLWEGSH
ncbi:unnamed protein product [Amoebophrya sp. A120]|nr:unnamed protein product [Amoebophrya sp. A120]|eukprot:GSA120T00024838001.1